MISVRLEGRLGNQLFQYAFIYAASRRLNTAFYLDKSVEKFILPQYFEVKNDFLAKLDNKVFSIPGYKNIFSFHTKKFFYHVVGTIIFKGKRITVDNETPADEVLTLLKNNHQYIGYFYSETYFEDFKDEIRTLFKIRKKHADGFELIINRLDISKKKAVIHVRRTDYVDLDISLPLTYYKKAIEMINGADIEYIFISDDPSFIEKEFSYIENKYISNHSEIIDLQFLINADICVLSNSSFSWWGAWLNGNQNKQVFAPKYWLGFKEGKEFPTGIADNLNLNWIDV
ncbi:alpha-1,2-fucosyltransferase [Mucilaginibacter sp.]|uniref:alpha-1,2-fucosyltransferase n=1 Tax=Mucilaginibacter sp. TaxID=1882438 RepID=UPI00284CC7A3|nr:alpha-1,2-fucosyltransferase [Mucilaginibacter sp.]MDR3695451.1 alpha-1,2-fucosyltransferase [Mucilaginibacter sp.]